MKKRKKAGRPALKEKAVTRNIYYPAALFRDFKKMISKINKKNSSNFSMNSRLIFLVKSDIKANS